MKAELPPEWAVRFLRWFCRRDLFDAVLGDLLELHARRSEKNGKRLADWLFVWNVLLFFQPFALKRKINNARKLNPLDMFQHNLLLTYRNFKRYKSSFFINLIGLSTGMACAILIYLWVQDEMSFDKFHKNDSRLYQVMRSRTTVRGDIATMDSNSDLLAAALTGEMPEIEYVASVTRTFTHGILSFDGKSIKANGQFAGKDFFNIFSYRLVHGEKDRVLNNRYAMVISAELATKLFGSPEKALDKTIKLDHELFGGTHIISGIFQKPKHNSSEKFDFVLTHELFMEIGPMDVSWFSNPVYTYLTLKPGTEANQFNDKIKDFIKTKNEKSNEKLFLRRYSDKYLFDHYENGKQAGGRIDYVILFSTIALFVLIIACINFMNLATARASRRSKEVGIKKVIGAGRGALVFQYFGEAMLLSFMSLVVAILLVVLLIPEFNMVTGKQLTIGLGQNLVPGATLISIITGFLAGSYPALYLSGFRPADVLKNKLSTSVGELWARKGLVIFQFSLSIILIIAVVIVYKQIDFVQSRKLGYNKDQLITFEKQGKLNESWESFLFDAKNIPGVVNGTLVRNSIINNTGSSWGHSWQGSSDNAAKVKFTGNTVGYDFIETLGIKIVQGRSFSRELNDKETKIILNETAVKAMGLKDPIGKWINLWGTKREIIGIVKDFHFQSLYKEINPLFLICDPEYTQTVVVKIQPGTERMTISRLEKLYHQYNPHIPFEFKFLDDDYQDLYESEQKVAVLSRGFAGIAILISCLGLFGLAAFTVERRIKEIGIRKILGSNAFGIVRLLLGDFTKMVVLAIAIALPASYLAAKEWLNDFAYRIDLEWWVFAGTGLVALLIAWLTSGVQALKAAMINPVQCLKDE